LGDEPRTGAPAAYNEVHYLRNQGVAEYVAMRDEELARYDYLLAKDREHNFGKPESEWTHEAEEYFQFLRPILRERVGTADAEDLKGANWFKKAAYIADADLKEFIVRTGQNFVKGATPTLAESVGKQNIVANAKTPWERYTLQAFDTVATMLPSIAVGKIAGPGLGRAVMGISVAGGAYKEAIDQYGMNEPAARLYSIMVAASEVGLQSLIGGLPGLGSVADDVLLAKVRAFDSRLLRFFGTLGVRVGSEILEEEAQLFIEPALRSLLTGAEYAAPGWEEMLDTAIITAMSTAATTLPGAAVSAFDTPAQKVGRREIKKNPGLAGELIDEALLLDPATNSYKLAKAMQDGSEKVNLENIGRLHSSFASDANAEAYQRYARSAAQVRQNLEATQQAVDEAQTIPYNKEVKTETATVLNRGESAYTTAGLPAAEAKTAAGIVQDLIDGKTVSDNKLKQLRLDNPEFRAVFTELTGVQFPEVVSKVQMRALARSAKNVAQETPSAQNEVQNAETETPSAQNEVQTATQELAAELAQAQESETPAAVSVETSTEAPSNRDSETLDTRRGPITRAQFREAMRRQPQYAEATDAELDAIFDDYRRDAEADDDIRFDLEDGVRHGRDLETPGEVFLTRYNGDVQAGRGIQLSKDEKSAIRHAIKTRQAVWMAEDGLDGEVAAFNRVYVFYAIDEGEDGTGALIIRRKKASASTEYDNISRKGSEDEPERTTHTGVSKRDGQEGSAVSNGEEHLPDGAPEHAGDGELAEGEPAGQYRKDESEGAGSGRVGHVNADVTYSPDYEHWRNAVKETEAQEAAEADDDIRFSVEGLETMLNMPWAEQYANRDSLPENSAMYTRETPDALQAVGLGDLALAMTTAHAKSATSGAVVNVPHAHHVTDAVVEQLPELMNDPVMILDSNTVPGDIMVVLDALDTQGNPVVATVHPNGHAWVGGEYGRANFITSVYGRDNLAVRPGADSKNNLLYLLSQPNKRGVLYWNRALTEGLFQKANLRVPYFLQNLPSDTVLKMRYGYNPNYVVERGVFDVSEEEENHAQDNRATHRGSSQRPGRSSADGGRAGRNLDHSAPGRDGGVRGQQTPEGVPGQDPGRTAPSVPAPVQGPARGPQDGPVGRGTVGELLGGVQEAYRDELGEARAQDEAREQVNTEDVIAVPQFKGWDAAINALTFGGVDGLSVADPLALDIEIVATVDGETQVVATYERNWDGLAQLNADLPGLVADHRVSAAEQAAKSEKNSALAEKCTADLFLTKDGYEYTDEQLVHPHNGKKFTVHALNLDKHASAKVRKRARFYEKLGFKTLLVPKGEIISNLGQMAGGATVRNTRGQAFVLVQDSDALQCITTEHEGLHVRLLVDYELFFTIRQALIDTGYEKTIDRLRKSAEKAWGGTYKPGKMGKKSAEYKYSYEQEVYAEALAGNPGKLGNDILAIQPIVQAVVEQWDAQFMEMRKQKPRGWTPEHSRPNVFELEWGYNADWTPDIADDSTQVYGDETYELNPKQQAWAEKFNAMHGPGTAEAVAAAVTDAFFRAQEEAKAEPVTASSVGSIAQQDEELLGVVTYGPKPSVGAADYDFDPYSRMEFEHGTIEPTGKTNHRWVEAPKSTNGVDRVSQAVPNIMSAKATPESRLGTIAGAVVDGKLSHNVKTDAQASNRARRRIRKNGFDSALAEWRSDVDQGRTSKDLVAMGAVLLNNAGNSDMPGEAYVDLLVDYSDLLTRAGQALQAAKLFKNLTPESRLYALQRTLSRMNRHIDPKENVSVDEWMKKVGNQLASRLVKRATSTTKKAEAKTVCQTILSDLTRYANEHLAKEETPGLERTEMDRILDLFHNYDHYTEAWEEAKQAVLEQYGKRADIVSFLEEWGESELDYARMLTNELLGAKEVTISRELADEYLRAGTDEARDAALDKILQSVADQIPATFMDKFTALRYTAMLGNLKTILKNTGGNLIMQPARLTKTTFAALAEAMLERAGINIDRSTSVHRDQEALDAAEAEFKKVKDLIAKGGRYGDESSNLPGEIRDRQRIFKTEVLEAARKGTKWLMDNTYFGDAAFSYYTFRDALSRYIAANHTTWSQAPEELKAKAITKAVKEAAEATFRDNNAVSDAITKLRYRNPSNWVEKGLNIVGEGILPFRRTPANVGVRIWEYSPFGLLSTAVQTVRAAKGLNEMTGSDVVNQLAKNATGTILALVGMGLRAAGVLTSGAPDDEKEKEQWELQGHQEYAIEIGGVSYTIDWAAPAAVALFTGAELWEAFNEKGLSVRDAAGLVGQLFDPMLEMSMLQGVDDALSNAQSYGDDSALVRFVGNALWSWVAQPVPTVLGQFERSLSNTRMTTYADKNKDMPDGIQRALGRVSAKVPGWDYAQIQYVDAWGRTQKNASNGFLNVIEQFISPGYANTIEESDMEKELLRLYQETGETSVLISNAPKYFTVGNTRKDLTGGEYLTYAKTRGQTAFQLMTDLTNSAAYKNLSDAEKVRAVEAVYDLANQTAKNTVTAGKTELDGWVKEAQASATSHGVAPQVYIAAKAAVSGAEGVKDKKTGKTVSGSKSMAMMLALYKVPGLTDKQREALAEELGIGKDARKLSKGILERRLARLQKQNS